MNAPVIPERLLLSDATPQMALPLARPGVMRWVWEGRFGTMLIEVEGDEIRVDGQRVEPHQSVCGRGAPTDASGAGATPLTP